MKSLLALFQRLRLSRPLQPGDAANDKFSRLPFELIFLILAYLEPSDLSDAARASRSLRCVLLSDEVWSVLADRWFPNLTGFIRLTAVNELDRSQLFGRALRKISRRDDGKFASAVHHGLFLESDSFFQLSKKLPVHEGGVHSYDIAEQEMNPESDEHRFTRFMVYKNGRIAWWPEAYSLPYFAIVDNLRTRTRRAYLFPHHEGQRLGYRTAMGDKLLLLSRGTTIHIWHLELDRLQSLEMPETFKRCATEGETVLIVSGTGDVYIWKYGQTLQHIDMSVLRCYPNEPVSFGLEVLDQLSSPFPSDGLYLRGSYVLIDFIISPKDPETFFVVTYPTESPQWINVYEIRSGERIASYKLDVSLLDARNIGEVGSLRSESIDSYGGYSLIHALMLCPDANREAIHNNVYYEASCPCGRKSQELISVCFNIYTKSFTVLYHHLPRSLSDYMFHLWNNRVYLRNSTTDGQSTLYEKYITSLEPCTSEQGLHDTESTIPVYSTIPTESSFFLQRQLLTSDPAEPCEEPAAVAFALDIYQEFTPGSQNPFQPPILEHKIAGDGHFLMFLQEKEYIVWSFGDEIPAKPAEADRKKPWWRRIE